MQPIRNYDDDRDRAAVADLILDVARHDGSEPLAEEKKAEWLRASEDVIALVSESLDAYLHASWSAGFWSIEMAFRPTERTAERVEELLAAGIRACLQHRSAPIHVWAFAPWLERHLTGHEVLRRLVIMGRDLPAAPVEEPTDSVIIEAFRVGSDEDRFLEVNNRAFEGHPENGGWDRMMLSERMSRPWFDPDGFFLASDSDGALLGFCWTKRHDPTTGEIYVIATDPNLRRKGLGRRLLRTGLAYMASEGCMRAILFVREGEDAAVGLYRSEGFVRLETRTEYLVAP